MRLVSRTRLTLPLLVGILLLAALMGGCGYRAVLHDEPLFANQGVDVVVFANRSYQAGVEGVLARSLVDELALRTGGRVVTGPSATLELTGTVLSYGSSAVSYNAQDQIREYRLDISVEAVLRDRVTQKVVWKGELVESQTYPVNLNLALQRNSEEAAAAKVCRRLAEDIWQKAGDRF
ncbi:hypothetical protein GMLC_20220 [Geomonas limicola]|uniref:Lipoprotein n=1 Tax=Geomonas limicola TaxID=2740186 RepID=A0A6V8NA87_9BACT|nr:LptE family protein [Geomonas limicola]GFO68443.1 hypothetical protein GMLC_20220 [Geomonas limicola]